MPSSGFEAIGQFGIGFFSVFMLGDLVRVTTWRYDPKGDEPSQWLLNFSDGINQRPTLREPVGPEKLKRHGTRVSVLISKEKLEALCVYDRNSLFKSSSPISFFQVCSRLAPAIDLNLYVKKSGENRKLAVKANDWFSLPSIDLLRRVTPGYYESTPADQFGPWAHFSELYDKSGRIIGRCAINPHISYWEPNFGIGVVKGLLAGTVDGVAGIIMSRPQNDLARKEAIPDISLAAVQQWAEKQKEILLINDKLGTDFSALLAHFGASRNSLMLGEVGNQSVSLEEFIDLLSRLNEVIVHDGDITYDQDDDNVLKGDFENNFEVISENLLVLPQLPRSTWRDQINDGGISCESWSLNSALEAALKAAWGHVDWDEDTVTVGYVNGNEISRMCRIATRMEE